MSSLRRVVVTGIGLATPLGLGSAAFAQALFAGRCGIRPIRSFDASELACRIGGEVEDFDPKLYLDKKDRKQLKFMVRTIQFAVAAAKLALEEGRLTPGNFDPARFGVVFGTGTIPGDLADLGDAARLSFREDRMNLARWGAEGIRSIPPMWMLNHVPNMPASHVSILNNAQGPNNTITQTDAASLLAIGEAVRDIRRGAADAMLAGGSDTRIHPAPIARYQIFSQLSTRNDCPERACRPFDLRRDGQVMGEGGGALLLEELGHAQRRNAPILAEVIGFAAGCDPRRAGPALARVLREALRRANISPAELDHINAHAPGTDIDDAWEARGIQQTLEGIPVPVTGLKGQLSNLGAGGGVVELAASLLALRDGVVPRTCGHEQTDPACPVDVIREPRPVRRDCVLKVSATDFGQCAAIVVRKWI